MTIKTLLSRIHLYLGVFFTPLILLFSFTGALQVFRLHQARKDGSYAPPQWLHDLASVHIRGVYGNAKSQDETWFLAMKWLSVGLGAALVVTAMLGVYLAFTRTPSRKRWMPLTALALGIAVPVAILLLQ